MPAALETGLVLLRELLRVLALPVHVLLYLPRQRHWRQRALDALAAASTTPGDAGETALRAFLARRSTDRDGASRPLLLSAGETSGEAHATRLMRSVHAAGAHPRWLCFGGPQMVAAGGELVESTTEHGVMGIAAVLASLPRILRTFTRYLRTLDRERPALVVLVDYPGLHLVMAAAAKRRGIPVLHYIAPQYWAWAPWRMRRYRRAVDGTLTIFPFEPAFFAHAGVPSAYIGHPLADHPAEPRSEQAPPLLCILPGSRSKELHGHLAGMVRVARELREAIPELEVVLPHSDPRRTNLIRELLRQHDPDGLVRHEIGPIGPWLSRARIALAKSGTGSLECCLSGTPTVVVYRVAGLASRFFLRNMLTVPWFTSANLTVGRVVAPEFAIEAEPHWGPVRDTLLALHQDEGRRRDALRGLAELRQRIGGDGASARAARWVLPFCSGAETP